MVVQGHHASSTPERTIDTCSDRLGITIPGEGHTHDNRVQALGALGA